MTSDPRVFFAAERTLLAWLRTGIGIVGLGFVVSKFGLFLRLTAGTTAGGATALPSTGLSQVLGISFVVLGALSIAVASVQHHRFVATLPPQDLPARYSRHWALWLSALVAVASVLLGVYLGVSAR
jgi:putative membrane protein